MDDLSLRFQVQLRPGGLWHRRNRVERDQTACGQWIAGPVKSRDHAARPGDNHLCPICFAPEEVETAKLEKVRQRAMEHAEADAYGFDEDADTDPWVHETLGLDADLLHQRHRLPDQERRGEEREADGEQVEPGDVAAEGADAKADDRGDEQDG